MKAFQKKRLLKLAEFLSKQVPKENFFMGSWGMNQGKPHKNPRECNTVGCALGWATVLFKRQGYCMTYQGPSYAGQHGIASAGSFFGLSECCAFQLFSASEFNWALTPKQVAKRIRETVAGL